MNKKKLFLSACLFVLCMCCVHAETKPPFFYDKQENPYTYDEENIVIQGIIDTSEKKDDVTEDKKTRTGTLVRWTAEFKFGGHTKKEDRYDVFVIKRDASKNDHINFETRNGYGLAPLNERFLIKWFETVMELEHKKVANGHITESQWNKFQEQVMKSVGNIGYFDKHHFEIHHRPYVRIRKVMEEMGAIDVNPDYARRRAIFWMSEWPSIEKVYLKNENDVVVEFEVNQFKKSKEYLFYNSGDQLIGSKKVPESKFSKDRIREKIVIPKNKFLNKNGVICLKDDLGREVKKSFNLLEEIDFKAVSLKQNGEKIDLEFSYHGDEFKQNELFPRGLPITFEKKDGKFKKTIYFTNWGKDLISTHTTFKTSLDSLPFKEEAVLICTVNDCNNSEHVNEIPKSNYENNVISCTVNKKASLRIRNICLDQKETDEIYVRKNKQVIISAKLELLDPKILNGVRVSAKGKGQINYPEKTLNLERYKPKSIGEIAYTPPSRPGRYILEICAEHSQLRGDKKVAKKVAINVIEHDSHAEFRYTGKDFTVNYTVDEDFDSLEEKEISYRDYVEAYVSLDTKQGEETIEKEDSRGSWDIRKFAQKNNKNANHITRAGYGIESEVKIKTMTDWNDSEIPFFWTPDSYRPPEDYRGPQIKKVIAKIYQEDSKKAKVYELEEKGEQGDYTIWHFVENKEEKFKNREAGNKRKIYTDVEWKDGLAELEITVIGEMWNGKEILLTVKHPFEIHGTMYDDVQNLPSYN